jgi:bifunctional UDP-N-acetylglucosamine pyrophosphorylase/glucosamine-1-phosphate N-acetyltransferase
MTIAAIVLAAGEGTRMKSDLPKVAHPVLGVPMVRLVVETARSAGCDPVVVVTGHRSEVVEALLPGERCVLQDRQLGTGHAVACAEEALLGFDGSVLVLSGDTPLMRAETLGRLVAEREAHGAAACVLTARMPDPTGYGRIVRDGSGELVAIVEHKDCDADQAAIDEVNTGTYCFDARTLFDRLDRLTTDNAQAEYYLTDMIAILVDEGLGVDAVTTDEPAETLGVNSRVQLAEATAVLQRRINTAHMLAGVTMTAPDLVWVGPAVTLGRDVVLEPMTTLLGDTVVGDGATVGPQVRAMGARIGAGATVRLAELEGVEVADAAVVGPFANLRADAAQDGERGERRTADGWSAKRGRGRKGTTG